jgi:TRAP-type C4-dicarboxylate transport system permease small subunit
MLIPILTWLRSSGPTWHYKRIWLDALITTLCLNVLAWMIFSKMGMTTHDIFNEDGPIEDIQSASLVITALFAVMAALGTRILARFVAITTACISVIFFMREMPLCRGSMTVYCVSKTWLAIIIGTVALILLIATIVFEYRHRGGLLRAIHPRLSWPLGLIAAVLGISQMAEHFDIVVMEESIESYGFMILTLSSIWLFRFSRTQHLPPLKVRAKAGLHKVKHVLLHH